MAAYPGLAWSKLEVSFSAGLQQQTDDRARPQPFLDICRDVQHDVEVGGLVTRFPYAAMSNAIFGGGALSNCRRLAVVNDELCVFTDVALYSWNAQLAKWVLRGTHLAVAVSETPRFVTTGDQIDADRAELAGTVLYSWNEGMVSFVAALDKTTGSVLVSPTSLGANTARTRLVALATKILLFVTEPTTLRVRAIDPADPATGIASAGVVINTGNVQGPYDVVRAGTQDLCVGVFARTVATSYTVFSVTPALASTTVTKARTCDGPIAVSTIPDGTQTQIVRTNLNHVQGDLLTTSGFADVFTAQAIGTIVGTSVSQIAAAHRSVQNGGAFRCYVFWSVDESATVVFRSKTNWVDNSGALGTTADFVNFLGVASRAFDRNGSVYVWMVFGRATSTFAGQGPAVQNTYFLYRDDAFLCGKAAAGIAGGLAPSSGRLPGVSTADGASFAWCGAFRRQIPLGAGGTGYAARANREIVSTFDTVGARRTAALGKTLYVTGAEVLQYDGVRLVEVGFDIYPYTLGPATGAGSHLAAGTYAYKTTWRYINGQGEQERSTTATVATVALPGGTGMFCTIMPDALTVTRKFATPPALEFWRTTVNPSKDAPFYLVTSKDPSASGANGYVANDPTTLTLPSFNDDFSDATASALETNPENETVLEALAPPPAQIIIPTDTRLFLAGVSGDPDRVWYSRERSDGEVASFHDELTANVPRPGGAITAIWFHEEVLYVGRQTAVYALPGVGLDNLGAGQQFGPAVLVSSDVGPVSQEAVALTPLGVIFLSRKGWQMLNGRSLQYIGGPVADFNSETVVSVDVVESQHQVRILTTARMLVWAYPRPDFPGGQWGEWTINDGIHSLMWNGTHVYLTATGPKQQQSSYAGLTYGQDAESAWVKPNGLMASAKIRRLQPLGEYRSAHLLRMRVAYNYDPTYVDDIVWTPSPAVVGGPLQMMHAPQRPRCEAIKVRLTAVAESVRATLATAGMAVTTSGTAWTSTWTTVASKPGELGNTVTMAISFELGSNLVDVRDNFTYTAALGWMPSVGRIGVRVACQAGTLTVTALETAIAAATALATRTVADATPSKTINAAGMAGTIVIGTFNGGAFGAPTGEALKLTGLGLEVGLEKGTLFTGLTSAQKA